MKNICKQTPLYKFLYHCELTSLPRKVLDCGAGGKLPPLILFKDYGYETHGIEIDDAQLSLANQAHSDLNIIKGDMLSLPFDDESFSFVYSYNSIFHMTKEKILTATGEMARVLRPGGLCFLNLLSTDDGEYGHGTQIGNGEFEQSERGRPVVHSYFDQSEADAFIGDLNIVLKETRVIIRPKSKQGYIDYILEK